MKTLTFEGRGSEYFRIWIVNILLTLVTLTLYYPWAKVRTRRYFYANTTLEDRHFDYHATGRQLFPGYLIVLVLVVIYVVSQIVFPVGGLVVAGVFLLALPWIIWRSLKFNLRMTSFSTVRFGFDGTAKGAYVTYFFWPLVFLASLALGPAAALGLSSAGLLEERAAGLLAIVLSLASYVVAFLLYAFIKKRQTHYMINGYRYGQGEFRTTVRTGGFAKILLKTIGLSLLIVLLVIAIVAAVAVLSGIAGNLLEIADQLDDPDVVMSVMSGALITLIVAVYIAFLFAVFLVLAYTYTRQRTYILGNSTLDGTITFASTLGAIRYAWVMVTNLLLVAITLGLGIPWARTRMARLVAEHTLVDTSVGFDAYVARMESEQSSLGEQIGDAFDVDVGIGF